MVYSDDYRDGWPSGFQQIGCEVRVFDVGILRRVGGLAGSPYRSTAMRGTTKGIVQNIVAWRPDLVWCHHGRACSADGFATALHQRGIQTAVYLCDEPYEVGETARYSPFFGHVFSMDPCTIAAHRKAAGHADRVWYLPAAARTDHFHPQPYAGRTTPALFLGNADLVPRPKWLDPVEEKVPGTRILYRPKVRGGKKIAVAKGDPDWVPFSEHPRLYGSCVVGLNVHRAPWITEECIRTRVTNRAPSKHVPNGMKLVQSVGPFGYGTGFWNDFDLPAGHVNPRFFEMAACGTCVVSDSSRFELARLFPKAPRAETPERFLSLVQWFLDHPELAEEVGLECSREISRRHTYRHRAAEVLHRMGLRDASHPASASCLGAPEGWLNTQDWHLLEDASPSDLTGLCGFYDPPRGTSQISASGKASVTT